MKKLLLSLLIASKCFAVSSGMAWIVPTPSGTVGSWNWFSGVLMSSIGPIIKQYAVNTMGIFNGSTDRPVVVSAGAPTYGLMIVRGGGTTGSSTISGGEGYCYGATNATACTGGTNGSSTQTVSFTTAFGDVPICTCTVLAVGSSQIFCVINSGGIAATGLQVQTEQSGGSATNASYNFICIGLRPSNS